MAFLVVGGGFAAFHARRIQGERDVARREAATARAVTGFVASLFGASNPWEAPQSRSDVLTARALLEEGTKRIRTELANQPEVRAELLSTLGIIHSTIGLGAQGQSLLTEALALRRQLQGPDGKAVADDVDRLAAVVAIRGLDEPLRALQEAGHVGRQAGVVAGDTNVLVARVTRCLERRIHRLVGRRARGQAVVGDLDGDAALLGEAEAHRHVGVGVVAERQELVAADLRERRARIEEDELLEGARCRARRVHSLVTDGDLEPREMPGGEEDDRGRAVRLPGAGRRRCRQRREDDRGHHGHQCQGPPPRITERVHRWPPLDPRRRRILFLRRGRDNPAVPATPYASRGVQAASAASAVAVAG